MGLWKARSLWDKWKGRVRVEPSRQTDIEDGPRVFLRCASCDWGRDFAPIETAERTCPRCGARLIESAADQSCGTPEKETQP